MYLSGDSQRTAEGGDFSGQEEIRKDGHNGGGIEDTAIDIGQLAKILKGACASGGTVKGRTIELQGDHKKKAAKVLEQNGYQVEVR